MLTILAESDTIGRDISIVRAIAVILSMFYRMHAFTVQKLN